MAPGAIMSKSITSQKEEEGKEVWAETRILRLRGRFIVTAVLLSCFVAFIAGRVARIQITNEIQRGLLESYRNELRTEIVEHEKQHTVDVNPHVRMTLPNPVMKQGKVMPRTTYTSKTFDTASATTHSRWIVTETDRGQCDTQPDRPECTPTPAVVASNESNLITEESLQEEHLPVGQHLLVDIENIDSAFLNSEERLATAMLELVDGCGLTLLSYHCHKLQPSGVSCAGVLLESHVSFHTWPSKGVITIDLFTCGPNSLLPFVQVVERLFAIPSTEPSKKKENPKTVWAHKYRGFGVDTDRAEATDMFNFPVGQMSDFKVEVS
jgi:S-adenosylmethionine decarboxylase proenzyme